MKLPKFILISAMMCTVFLLNGCRHSSEGHEQRIIQWLDNTYGKNSYTMKKDVNRKRYFIVTLNKYPQLNFRVTIARDVKTGSSYLWTNFDEIFCKHAIKDFKKTYDIGSDQLQYMESLHFIYTTNAHSLEKLKFSYDKMMNFITFVSKQYPILIDMGILDMRMDVNGIRLKGRDDSDKWIYLNIAKVKQKTLKTKPYKEIYDELKPMLITHSENPKGLTFHADEGRSFILGSDTLDDCLYKNLVLTNATRKQLKNTILQPGEISQPYTLKSENNYQLITITLQAKNLSNSPVSLLNATIVKATIKGGKTIYIDPAWIELEDNKIRKWIDPYKALGISPPKTEQEKKEGVLYKHTKVLFEMSEYYPSVKKVILTFQK